MTERPAAMAATQEVPVVLIDGPVRPPGSAASAEAADPAETAVPIRPDDAQGAPAPGGDPASPPPLPGRPRRAAPPEPSPVLVSLQGAGRRAVAVGSAGVRKVRAAPLPVLAAVVALLFATIGFVAYVRSASSDDLSVVAGSGQPKSPSLEWAAGERSLPETAPSRPASTTTTAVVLDTTPPTSAPAPGDPAAASATAATTVVPMAGAPGAQPVPSTVAPVTGGSGMPSGWPPVSGAPTTWVPVPPPTTAAPAPPPTTAPPPPTTPATTAPPPPPTTAPAPPPAPAPTVDGTPIAGESALGPNGWQIAAAWAQAKGASPAFVNLAESYWVWGAQAGIRPEVAYSQSALETGWGNFGGVLDASYHNPAGIKTEAGGSDTDREAHQRFPSWDYGVRAHLNHLQAYVGPPARVVVVDPSQEPHPRYRVVAAMPWAGTVATVEGLAGRWAPSSDYGAKLVGLVGELVARGEAARTGTS